MIKTISTAAICLFAAFTLQSTVCEAQHKSSKKQSTENDCDLTAAMAGKFAKEFGNKMYNSPLMYGDKHSGYTFSILGWKTIRGNQGECFYLVKVETSWLEGTGGIWRDWKQFSYKGLMLFDEFGCHPAFFIKEKKETSVFGIAKRAWKVPPDTKKAMEASDDWLQGIEYNWYPDGCLE